MKAWPQGNAGIQRTERMLDERQLANAELASGQRVSMGWNADSRRAWPHIANWYHDNPDHDSGIRHEEAVRFWLTDETMP